jgi:hypothetical protein
MVPVMRSTSLDYVGQNSVCYPKRVIHVSGKAMHGGDGDKSEDHGDKRVFSGSLRGIVSERKPNAIERGHV